MSNKNRISPSGPVFAPLLDINLVTSEDYTIESDDLGLEVRRTFATANNTEIPLNATVKLPIGFIVIIAQGGAGLSTVTKEVGVTLNSSNLNLDGLGTSLYAHKVDVDEWDVVGGVA